jgi:HEAT repeat protein
VEPREYFATGFDRLGKNFLTISRTTDAAHDRTRVLGPLLLALSAPLMARSTAGSEPLCLEEHGSARRVAIALLRSSRRREGPSHEEVARSLAGLGSEGIEICLDLLAARKIPPLVENDAAQTLSVPQRAMILDSLARGARSDILIRMESRVASNSDEATRIAALYVYSALGGERQLPRLSELSRAETGDGEEGLSADLAEALREAHARILEREPQSHRSMPKLLLRATSSQRRAMLFALGETSDPCALPGFAEVLRRHPECADLVISQALRVGASADDAVNETFAELVRPHLRDSRAALISASARLLGSIDDFTSASELVPLLDHAEEQVRESAHWALRRMSRLDFGARSAAWSAWLASELDWWGSEGRTRIEQLTLGSRSTRIAAVDACGSHTLGRSRLATALQDALSDNDALLRAKACDALAQLASPVALGGLLLALDDREPSVSDAARAALERIHGSPLPASSAECRRVLHL